MTLLHLDIEKERGQEEEGGEGMGKGEVSGVT